MQRLRVCLVHEPFGGRCRVYPERQRRTARMPARQRAGKRNFRSARWFHRQRRDAEEAIAREVMEETGTRVVTANYLFSLPNLYLYSGLTIPTMDLFFECTTEDLGLLKAADDVGVVPIYSGNPTCNPTNSGSLPLKKPLRCTKNLPSPFRLSKLFAFYFSMDFVYLSMVHFFED